jgi:WhiB family redox-sensing transcriptional regulator
MPPDLIQLSPRKLIPLADMQALRKWSQEARCKGLPADWFYDDNYANSNNADAIKMCEGCPVKEPCKDWAIKYEEHGVWGGLTPAQRRTLRRRKRYGYQ